jgi:cysteine desulfurase
MIYLDHAATTPVSPEVLAAMQPYFTEKFGNPSSIYALGREAKDSLCNARHRVQEMLGADKPGEIIFTSGATESNNLALKGVCQAAAEILRATPHIIVSSLEHHCVLDSAKYLEKTYGVEVTYLPVNKEGLVNPADVEAAIRDNTALISVMYGNNEMGAIEPISEIGRIVKEAKSQRLVANSKTPLIFHTDAVQAFQYLDTNVNKLGVDMLSLTAHKFYGPKGVGLLYVRRGTKFNPQQQGGAQERGQRAGTENIPYIVGMAEAMAAADAERQKTKYKIQKLGDYLIERVMKEISEVELLGPKDPEKRLPHIAAFLFKRIEGESILINLDMLGIAASSGSACTSGSLEPSHVTKAMGYTDMDAHGAIRFSLGKKNTKEDIDELMKHLPGIVEKLRAMSPIR